MLWAALIRKVKTKADFKDGIPDIAFVEADTKDEAIEAILRQEWPEEWWTNQSKTQLAKVVPVDPEDKVFQRLMAQPTPSPKRRRRRRKNANVCR